MKTFNAFATEDWQTPTPDMIGPPKKKRLTPDQKKALDRYRFACAQEERYLGSVFVTGMGTREKAATVKLAYDACKRLGLGMEHGL